MKAKLCVFVLMLAFSGLVHAEYYLVYPMTDSTCCYNKHRYHKTRHHYAKHRVVKKKHVVRHHRRSHVEMNVYYPEATSCGGCSSCERPCGHCVSCNCNRPGYVIYTGEPSRCTTYQDVVGFP